MNAPAFQLCRRCRTHMAPAFDEHSRFCTRGCWEQHHHRRCVVCEREFDRKRENQHACPRKTCRALLRTNPEIYRPFHLGHRATRPALRGLKTAVEAPDIGIIVTGQVRLHFFPQTTVQNFLDSGI